MVPATGIEPVTFSLEGCCSSTELRGRTARAYLIYQESQKKSIKIPTKVRISVIYGGDVLSANTLLVLPNFYNHFSLRSSHLRVF